MNHNREGIEAINWYRFVCKCKNESEPCYGGAWGDADGLREAADQAAGTGWTFVVPHGIWSNVRDAWEVTARCPNCAMDGLT